MKHTIFTISFILSCNVSAFQLDSFWTPDYKKVNKISCNEDEYICQDICDSDSCEIEENYCRSCIGNDPYITSIFSTLGLTFQNTNQRVSNNEIYNFIKDNRFISITSKSVYNNIDSYDSPVLQQRFQSLCPEYTAYPILLLELEEGNIPGNLKYVVCQSHGEAVTYRMTNDPHLNVRFNDDTEMKEPGTYQQISQD